MLSIAVFAEDRARFEPRPILQYPNHQTSGGVTAAASVFETDDQARLAFGKVNPYKHGVLPVLVIIQNDSKTAIRTDRIQAEYIGPDRSKVENTPAADVRFIEGPRQPSMTPGPWPGGIPHIGGNKKPPLSEWEIEGRAFAAKMIPPGQSASGFFYFQTGHRSGSTLYVSGLRDAATGQELMFFELLLEKVR